MTCAVTLTALAPSNAAAGEHRLVWEEHWPRFRPGEYAYTGSAWLSFGVMELFAPVMTRPTWQGGIGPDEAIRRALVARSRSGRARAGVVSDYMWYGTQALVWADVALPTLLDDFNFDVARELALENYEVLGPVALVSRLGERFAGRARPSYADCQRHPSYEPYCNGGVAAGFPSGHVSMSFAAAGVSCAHHQYLPLYGGGPPDAIACAAILSASSVGGVLRIVADRHYATDVFVGAIMGFAAGYTLPVALHYAAKAPDRSFAPAEHQTPARLASRRPLAVSFGLPF